MIPGAKLGRHEIRSKLGEDIFYIFSFGAIFYEMLSNRRAFHGESAAETIHC
jgi:hypothetical protein